jgi:hypothetical protein
VPVLICSLCVCRNSLVRRSAAALTPQRCVTTQRVALQRHCATHALVRVAKHHATHPRRRAHEHSQQLSPDTRITQRHTQSPTHHYLRANPSPEVTDPFCRLPLPTLFYATRGCAPWRPAADMGTAWREIHSTNSLGFSRAGNRARDTARGAVLYVPPVDPISGQAVLQGLVLYARTNKEKTTLPRSAADVSEFVCVAALSRLAEDAPCEDAILGEISPRPSAGILTGFPFGNRIALSHRRLATTATERR